MRRFPILLGLLVLAISGASIDANEGRRSGTPIHGVQFTQKGYIQFLRWELPVPEIHEFTFCLWLKSSDLEQPHSILSYSRNERERLIRSWISSGGRSVHLEIGGLEVFRRPARIREHRWYHVCQSWENQVGRYGLWIDGRLESQGRSDEMIGHVIPADGDVVLGQEYTDFDEGLEEGIEGSVLGFNLLLASAFDRLEISDNGHRHSHASSSQLPRLVEETGRANLDPISRLAFAADWSRRVSRRADATMTRDDGTSHLALIQHRSSVAVNDTRREEEQPPTTTTTTMIRRRAIILDEETADPFAESSMTPLGLQLVKLSYVRCQLGRASPPIGGRLMLISWSRTPVKVFGGAIVKNVGDECGKF